MKRIRTFAGFLLLVVICLSFAGRVEADAGYSMYCSNCGASVNSDDNFCWACGHRVGTQSSYSSDRRIIGYYMVHYGTQEAASPHYRMFRNYSIKKNYSYYGARESYGEKHFTRYVDAYMLTYAKTYAPGTLIKGDYGGYQRGTSTAYSFGDDKYVWFIESIVYG